MCTEQSNKKVISNTGYKSAPPSEQEDSQASRSEQENLPVPPNGGYGWIIVAAGFFELMTIGSLQAMFALSYPALVDVYDSNLATIGSLGSLSTFAGMLIAPLYSDFVKRYGSRKVALVGNTLSVLGLVISAYSRHLVVLFFMYGFLAGLGTGLVMLSTVVIAQQYFTTRRPLANSFLASGVSIGMMLGGPLAEYSLTTYGVGGHFMVFAALQAQCIVCAALYRPVPRLRRVRLPRSTPAELDNTDKEQIEGHPLMSGHSEKNDTCAAQNETLALHPTTLDNTPTVTPVTRCGRVWRRVARLCDRVLPLSMLRNGPLLVFYLAIIGRALGTTTVFSHLPNRALVYGVSRSHLAYLPLAAGAASTVGRLAVGPVGVWVAARHWEVGTVAAVIILHGVVVCLGSLVTDLTSGIVYMVATSLAEAPLTSLTPPSIISLAGLSAVAAALSYNQMCGAVGAFTAIPLAGALYETFRDYNVPFYVAGSLEIIGGSASLVTWLLTRKHAQSRDPK